MNREQQIVLYFLYQQTSPAGEFVVGRKTVAGLLGVATMTAAKRLKKLVVDGLVKEVKKSVPRGYGFRYEYHITETGVLLVDRDFKMYAELYSDYRLRKLEAAIREATRISRGNGRAKKINDKQMRLF